MAGRRDREQIDRCESVGSTGLRCKAHLAAGWTRCLHRTFKSAQQFSAELAAGADVPVSLSRWQVFESRHASRNDPRRRTGEGKAVERPACNPDLAGERMNILGDLTVQARTHFDSFRRGSLAGGMSASCSLFSEPQCGSVFRLHPASLSRLVGVTQSLGHNALQPPGANGREERRAIL